MLLKGKLHVLHGTLIKCQLRKCWKIWNNFCLDGWFRLRKKCTEEIKLNFSLHTRVPYSELLFNMGKLQRTCLKTAERQMSCRDKITSTHAERIQGYHLIKEPWEIEKGNCKASVCELQRERKQFYQSCSGTNLEPGSGTNLEPGSGSKVSKE